MIRLAGSMTLPHFAFALQAPTGLQPNHGILPGERASCTLCFHGMSYNWEDDSKHSALSAALSHITVILRQIISAAVVGTPPITTNAGRESIVR